MMLPNEQEILDLIQLLVERRHHLTDLELYAAILEEVPAGVEDLPLDKYLDIAIDRCYVDCVLFRLPTSLWRQRRMLFPRTTELTIV